MAMIESMFQVIDATNGVKHVGTEASCKDWVRRTNSGFFCRVVEVEAVEGGTPLTQQLRACLSKIKRETTQEQVGSTNG